MSKVFNSDESSAKPATGVVKGSTDDISDRVQNDSDESIDRTRRNGTDEFTNGHVQEKSLTLENLPIPRELAEHPRYHLVRPLGRGGMGVVWLAEHLMMQRLVAVKLIRDEGFSSHDSLERFRREVQAIARLNHPNIVAAYDADRVEDTIFLVVEYINGKTLHQTLDDDGPLKLSQAARCIRDAAQGLAHAHSMNIIHRDVKPSNLILGSDGHVKLLDFGLVSLTKDESTITGENILVGTADYISPEQAEDPRSADARSDIYSLGCTFYQLLTGQPPYHGMSILKKLDAHRHHAFPSLKEIFPDIAGRIDPVIAKLTAKAPQRRYQSANEVIEAISHFCDDKISFNLRDSEQANWWNKNRRLALIVGGLLAITGFTSLLLAFRPKVEPMSLLSENPNTKDGVESQRTKPKLESLDGKKYSLLEPSSFGDGSFTDVTVTGKELTLDATNNQVWLNFLNVQSKQLSIESVVKFEVLKNIGVVKFSFLSPDYKLEHFAELTFNGLAATLNLRQAGPGFETKLKSIELKLKPNQREFDLTVSINADEFSADVVGFLPLKSPIDTTSAVCFPAISARNCRATLIDPQAVKFE